MSELNAPEPSDYRGSIILEYEKLIQSLFQSNSLILRLSGLYDDNTNWLKDFIKNFNGVKRDLPNKYLKNIHYFMTPVDKNIECFNVSRS